LPDDAALADAPEVPAPLARVPAPGVPAPLADEPLPDDDALAIVPVTCTRLLTCDESSDAVPSSWYVDPRPAAALPEVPAAPGAPAAPDVPAAPDDDPELAELEPLPMVASVRMNAAPDCGEDADALPALPLPLAAPARCKQPVKVTVPAGLV
jgi:hypothetical protein